MKNGGAAPSAGSGDLLGVILVTLGERRGFVDLGAERPIAAQQGDRRIAIEIKSFTGPSPVADLETASLAGGL
jgi:hypothetical protein